MPKIPDDEHIQSAASSLVFGYATEVMSMEELNLFQED